MKKRIATVVVCLALVIAGGVWYLLRSTDCQLVDVPYPGLASAVYQTGKCAVLPNHFAKCPNQLDLYLFSPIDRESFTWRIDLLEGNRCSGGMAAMDCYEREGSYPAVTMETLEKTEYYETDASHHFLLRHGVIDLGELKGKLGPGVYCLSYFYAEPGNQGTGHCVFSIGKAGQIPNLQAVETEYENGPLTLSTKPIWPVGSPVITVKMALTEPGRAEMGCAIGLERQIGGRWVTVNCFSGFEAVGLTMTGSGQNEESILTGNLALPLEEGHYRVTKPYTFSGAHRGNYTACCEFSVGSGPEFPAEESITAIYTPADRGFRGTLTIANESRRSLSYGSFVVAGLDENGDFDLATRLLWSGTMASHDHPRQTVEPGETAALPVYEDQWLILHRGTPCAMLYDTADGGVIYVPISFAP